METVDMFHDSKNTSNKTLEITHRLRKHAQLSLQKHWRPQPSPRHIHLQPNLAWWLPLCASINIDNSAIIITHWPLPWDASVHLTRSDTLHCKHFIGCFQNFAVIVRCECLWLYLVRHKTALHQCIVDTGTTNGTLLWCVAGFHLNTTLCRCEKKGTFFHGELINLLN